VALIALVALAVDGGNAYNQRRIAQNAVDGATTAAMTKLYNMFLAHRVTTGPNAGTLTPITPNENIGMLNYIKQTLAASGYGDATTDPNHYGIDTTQTTAGGTLEAYWIKADGTRYGNGQMGFQTVNFMDPNNLQGLTGIWIKTTATSPTYIARLIGQNKVQSDAHAGGRLESATSLTGPQAARIWPLGFPVDRLPGPGGSTQIYHNGPGGGTGPGNWFEIDFYGSGNSRGSGDCHATLGDWFDHGFNPGCGLDQAQEVRPLHQPIHHGDYPDNNDYNMIPNFPLGNDGSVCNGAPCSGTTGVWVYGQSGVGGVNSSCDILQQAANEHWDVLIPIYDVTSHELGASGGNNLRYHLIGLGRYTITSLDSCQGQDVSITGTFNGWATSTNVNGDPNLIPGITLGDVILQIGQ